MSFKNKFLTKKKIFYIFIPIIILITVLIFVFSKNGQYDFTEVKTSDYVSEVSVVGTVIPSQETNMAFEMSGRVVSIYKKVGDKVNQGESILALQSADINAKLLRAQADYEGELAKLNKLKNDNSTTDLTSIKNAIRTGYTSADDAIRSKVDQMFTDPNSRFPEIKIFISKIDDEKEVETGRYEIRRTFESWAPQIQNVNSVNNVKDLKDNYVPLAKQNLSKILDYLDFVSYVLSTSETTGDISQSDLDKYTSDISSARTNINKALSDLNSAVSSVANNTQDIPFQESKVKSALANINEIRAELSKNTISAPFTGILTKIDVEIGEIVGSADSAVSIISDNAFQIETFIPEVNIKDIQIGNTAKIKLDAFGDEEYFDAKVITIEPAQTVRDGVSTYKTKFEFNQKDDRIRSGMTANVIITTENRSNAILIPPTSIYKKDGFDYVKVLVGKNVVEKQVTLGAFDSKGNREIVSGLSFGEKVIKDPQSVK
jgi:RND family efflux transporter MFP subunit